MAPKALSRKSSVDGKKAAATDASPPALVPSLFVIELPLPLGIGLSEENVITETSDKADSRWQVGDRICWADGKEVRGGKMGVGDAINRARTNHEFVVQRAVEPSASEVTFIVRLTGQSLGIGLSKLNSVTDTQPNMLAAKDGRIQVRAACRRPARAEPQPACTMSAA